MPADVAAKCRGSPATAPALSRAALADVIVRVGALVADIADIAEIDLNPVVCREDDCVVVDARMRIAACEPAPDPLARRLRPVVPPR